jgi:hypothetical protein
MVIPSGVFGNESTQALATMRSTASRALIAAAGVAMNPSGAQASPTL